MDFAEETKHSLSSCAVVTRGVQNLTTYKPCKPIGVELVFFFTKLIITFSLVLSLISIIHC
jgi:hypothetical protein